MSCQKYSTHTYFAFQSKQAALVFLLGSAIFSNFYEQFHAQRACHGVGFFSSYSFFFFFRKIVSSNLNSPKRTRRLCVILEFQIWPYTYVENNISMLFMAHKYLEIGYKTCLLNSQCSGKVNLQKKQQKLMFSNFAPNVFWEK